MRSRNTQQLGMLLLTIGALCLALMAGYGIAALAVMLQPGRQAAADMREQRSPEPSPARPQAVLGVTDEPAALEGTLAPELAPPVETPPAERVPDAGALLEDRFDSPLSGWLERETPGWSAGYVDGRYRLALTGQPTIGVSAALPADSYRLDVDIAVEQGAGGVIFLAAEPDVFYRLMLSRDGLYAIDVLHQAQSTVTYAVDWTVSDALKRAAGATYRVRIERQRQQMRFWVDDAPLLTWAVPASATSSQYGFAVSSADGRAAATFDNLVAARLSEAGAP